MHASCRTAVKNVKQHLKLKRAAEAHLYKATKRKVEAALKLQKVWRGFLGVRCRLKEDNAMREGE